MTIKQKHAHLEGLKDVFDEEEVLQRADGRQSHDDGFPHVHVSFFSTQTDVQVQVRPEGNIIVHKETISSSTGFVCFIDRWGGTSLEGMLPVAPVEDVKDFVVDADRDGEAHDGHGDGGEHSDDAELEQGQQAHH